MSTDTRIMKDEVTGKYIDEYLEVSFKQIFEWNVTGEQGAAIEQILEQYTARMFDKNAVSCSGITTDPDAAARWASQFGELRISRVAGKLLRTLRDENEAFNTDTLYAAKVGPDTDGQEIVFGRTEHQVALLAGVQILRVMANDILNKGENQHHH